MCVRVRVCVCVDLISATSDNQLFTKRQMASCSQNVCTACDRVVSDTIGEISLSLYLACPVHVLVMSMRHTNT